MSSTVASNRTRKDLIMKVSVKILILLVLIHSGVLKCLPINGDERVTVDAPHTKILDTAASGSLEDLPSKPCSEEVSNILNDESRRNFKHKVMVRLPAKIYVNNLQYANEFMVATTPLSAMEYLAAVNRNWYPNTYSVRSLPMLDDLPSVYVSRPRTLSGYYENREPLYYDPELLNSQKTVLVPINLNPETTTSEEDFWAQLSQDAIMNNIIPTMEIRMPRDPYERYNQLLRSPYPLSAQELLSNNVVTGFYPESELRNYDHPLLNRFKSKFGPETETFEDYPHTVIRTTE